METLFLEGLFLFLQVVKVILAIAFSLILCGIGRSQSDKDSIDYYFDDNNISNARVLIKLDIAGALAGDYGARIEYKLNNAIGVEAGLSYWTGELLLKNAVDYPLTPSSKQASLSYHFQTRFYYTFFGDFKAPFNIYSALYYRYRSVDYDGAGLSLDKVNSHEALLATGYQWLLGKRLAGDINFSAGIAFFDKEYISGSQDNGPFISSQFLYNIGIKIAYRL